MDVWSNDNKAGADPIRPRTTRSVLDCGSPLALWREGGGHAILHRNFLNFNLSLHLRWITVSTQNQPITLQKETI